MLIRYEVEERWKYIIVQVLITSNDLIMRNESGNRI